MLPLSLFLSFSVCLSFFLSCLPSFFLSVSLTPSLSLSPCLPLPPFPVSCSSSFRFPLSVPLFFLSSFPFSLSFFLSPSIYLSLSLRLFLVLLCVSLVLSFSISLFLSLSLSFCFSLALPSLFSIMCLVHIYIYIYMCALCCSLCSFLSCAFLVDCVLSCFPRRPSLLFAYYVSFDCFISLSLSLIPHAWRGAIVLRICFISLGYSLMNTGVYLVKFAFGAVLVYSGIKRLGKAMQLFSPPKPLVHFAWLLGL